MIIVAGILIGAIIGATIARRRGGNALDIAQYSGSMGIAFGILGVIATIIIQRASV